MNVNLGSPRIAICAAVFGIAGGLTACTTDSNDPGAGAGSGGTAGTPMGTGGAGGAAGATGAGGMAPSGTVCALPISIAAATPGIADFDAYDGTALGSWTFPLGGDSVSGVTAGVFGYGDRPAGNPETFEMAAGQNSKYAMRIADTLAQVYGGGMGTWLSACLNATKFAGVSFWARGSTPMGKSALTLSMQETLPSKPAKAGDAIGTCAGTVAAKTCVHPTFAVAVTDTWTKIQAPWSAFTAGSAAGTAVSPDGRNITQVQFGVELIWVPDAAGVYAPIPAPYDLAVDSLTFY